MLCLASSLAPPSSDGHGQHWPLDEAFILRQEREREGVHLRGAGGVISDSSVAGGATMAHVALESTTHPVESMCVSTLCGSGKRDAGESERMCGADATN